MRSIVFASSFVSALSLVAACGDDGSTCTNCSEELITTVVLDFGSQSFEVNDEDGDGGTAPTIEPILIAPGTFTVSVSFQNRLETPAEEITDEVRDEGVDHQVFFTGSAIDNGRLVHTYADTDDNDLPIGLSNTLVATPGTGELTVTLRHMPPLNGTAVKTADAADKVKTSGFSAIGGTTDAQVTFPVTIGAPN